DNYGRTAASNSVAITVNSPPSVNLTSPTSGTQFIAPAIVSINATASDSDGSVSKIEFFQGTTLLSVLTTSPYTFSWLNVPAGTYSLTARATDNLGAQTTSGSVTVNVAPNVVGPGKIAFASNRDGNAQIYLMNTDGTSQV